MSLVQQCLTPWSVVINQFSSGDCTPLYAAYLPNDSITVAAYLFVFLKTYLLELGFYFFFLRPLFSFKKVLCINLVINLATHPIIFLVMPYFFSKYDLNYLQYLIIAETFAPTIEALILIFYFKVNWKTAAAAAVLANIFSWSAGVYLA